MTTDTEREMAQAAIEWLRQGQAAGNTSEAWRYNPFEVERWEPVVAALEIARLTERVGD